MTAPIALYFGCSRDARAGHFLWAADGRTSARLVGATPEEREWFRAFEHTLDCTYAPRGSQVQGRALRHHVHGWTIVAWWDRTVDSRGNSNSAVLIRGEYTFDEAMAWARRLVPWVFERQAFEVVNAAEGDTIDARLMRLVEARIDERYETKELVR